jgi:hypothetical protein
MNITKRLESIEKAVGTSGRADSIPEPFEMLTPEDQEFLRQYIEQYRVARDTGADLGDRPEWCQAMNRYIRKCVEHDRLMREAGVSMEPIDATLRRLRYGTGQEPAAGVHVSRMAAAIGGRIPL